MNVTKAIAEKQRDQVHLIQHIWRRHTINLDLQVILIYIFQILEKYKY